MQTVTLAQLKQRARVEADQVGSQFIPDSDLVVMLNDSLSELYDLLVGAYADYFHKSYDLTTVQGQDTYPLPSDFYKLTGVDETISSRPCPLKKYEFAERGNYRPINRSGTPIKLWYIPAFTKLALDTDTFDGINGWEEYAVIDTAIKMKDAEESDVSVLSGRLAKLGKRIEALAPSRDASAPSRIIDVSPSNRDPFWDEMEESQIRYRVMGGNVQFVEACWRRRGWP
jgi:hypothetical protein